MARWQQYIHSENSAPGVITVTVQTCAYPMVADHWKQQLTGRNKAKWGKIYIDPDPASKRERRSIALAPFAGLYKGEVGNNNDECPGAMFIWESQEISHVQPCDAVSNQEFGRDLYRALESVVLRATPNDPRSIKQRMAWWQVEFRFV